MNTNWPFHDPDPVRLVTSDHTTPLRSALLLEMDALLWLPDTCEETKELIRQAIRAQELAEGVVV